MFDCDEYPYASQDVVPRARRYSCHSQGMMTGKQMQTTAATSEAAERIKKMATPSRKEG